MFKVLAAYYELLVYWILRTKGTKANLEQTGAEMLAAALATYNSRYVFGVPGGQTLSLYDSISRFDTKVRHVLVRDEKAGALMAIGFFRTTFRPGICDATVGPGAANLLPAVVEAYTGSASILAITSNVTTDSMGKGASQELDHKALFAPFVKISLRPRTTREIPEIANQAFKIATTGRPGPVHIDLPQDLLEGRTEAPSFEAHPEYEHYPSSRPSPRPESVALARELILKSSKPIILAGGGSILSQAWKEVKELAELIGAPVVTTLTGKGIISEEHPLSLGCVGRQGYRPTANRALRETDLIIALGTKLGQVPTNNWKLINEATARIIHIDIDNTELRKVYKQEVAIVADIKSFLNELISALSSVIPNARSRPDWPWLQRVQKLREEWSEIVQSYSSGSALTAARIYKEIMKALPPKSILVTSGSFAGAFSGCFYNVRLSGTRFIAARGVGGTETALPVAIGATLGVEDESKVIAVSGDGGFGYHIAELETARRLGVDLTVIVLNNKSMAWMKFLQQERFDSNFVSSSYLSDLNYAKIAESFGCEAARVEKESELTEVLSEAKKKHGVFVLEAMIDPEECSSTHLRSDPLAKME